MRERSGTVISFHTDKKFGFVRDAEGDTHFAHASEVVNASILAVGQDVEFDIKPTPKGSRAVNISALKTNLYRRKITQKEQAYVDPDQFVMTREPEVRGCIIVSVLDTQFWAKSNDPNEAREMVKQNAISLGGNAVVSLDVQRHTEQAGCSNYKYTMHLATGAAVIVKRVVTTNDPAVIQASRDDMSAIEKRNEQINAEAAKGDG